MSESPVREQLPRGRTLLHYAPRGLYAPDAAISTLAQTALKCPMYRREPTVRLRVFTRRVRRFVMLKILHADDPPNRLALGVAIGMFMAFTPTVGTQTILVLGAAWLLRANKVVGLPLVWLTNPATIMPVYYSCYVIGCLLLNHEGIGPEWWLEFARAPHGWWASLWFYWERLMEIAKPLWAGCLVVSAPTAAISYAVVYFVIRWYRLRRWGRLVPNWRARSPESRPDAAE